MRRIEQVRKIKEGEYPKVGIKSFGKKLRNFQEVGVAFQRYTHRGFLCDTMGLGKTIQAIGVMSLCNLYPVLIVCPASAIHVWTDEIKACIKSPILDISVLNGKSSFVRNEITGVNIVSFDMVGKLKNEILQSAPDLRVIFVDEIHYLRNQDAKRTSNVYNLVKEYPQAKVFGLTGTPLCNRPRELSTQLEILGLDEYFGKRRGFLNTFCVNKETGSYSGGSNLIKLNRMLEPFMIRRRKKHVLLELPDSQRITIQMNGSPGVMEDYRKAESDFVLFLKEQAAEMAASQNCSVRDVLKTASWNAIAGIQIMRTTKLKQLIAKAKTAECIAFLRNFLMESDEQIVVFGHHKNEIINPIASEFGWPAITGSTDPRGRKDLADLFMGGHYRGIVVSTKCAVSLSLHSATSTLTTELPWVPADDSQCNDRVRRIGQTQKTTHYYAVIKNSIDDRVIELLLEKQAMISQAIDGETLAPDQIHGSLFGDLAAQLVMS
jgi:SWI/SNF-related matrix-associated actin-dependent regulator 1 of chromatin subfamily A